MWIARIELKPNTRKDVSKVCQDIASKDSSFIYSIDDKTLSIMNEDRNKIWKKSLWMVHKVDLLKGNKLTVKKYFESEKNE